MSGLEFVWWRSIRMFSAFSYGRVYAYWWIRVGPFEVRKWRERLPQKRR